MRYFTLAIMLMSYGCATQPLSTAEKSVRILKKSDPERNCKELGKVHAPGLGSMDDNGREADLKRATVKAGGNTVTLDRIDENRTHFGTAYICQK